MNFRYFSIVEKLKPIISYSLSVAVRTSRSSSIIRRNLFKNVNFFLFDLTEMFLMLFFLF